MEGENRPRRERPPSDQGRCYDLIVWNKSSRTMRAVIEVKRSLSLTQALRRDARRVTEEGHAGLGYLLVYMETKTRRGRKAIVDRFSEWKQELALRWLNRNRGRAATSENGALRLHSFESKGDRVTNRSEAFSQVS